MMGRSDTIGRRRAGRVALVLALCWATPMVFAADRPEPEVLPREAYRVPLDQVIVTGKAPYWRGEDAPRWDKPKVEAPAEAEPSRLQWAPHYGRDEREDYNGVRDQLNNPQPRTKLFELKF